MKNKKRKRISGTTAIMLRIIALFFSIWLVAMVYQTILSAEQKRDNWKENVEYLQDKYFDGRQYYYDEISYDEISYDKIAQNFDFTSSMYRKSAFHFTNINSGCYFFSNEGQLLWNEGNYALIRGNRFTTSAGESVPYFLDTVYIDLDVMPPEFLNVLEEIDNFICYFSTHDCQLYGYYEGKTFVPVKVILENIEDHSLTILYENTAEADRNLECITQPYPQDLWVTYTNSKTAPAIIGEKKYANLQEFAQVYYSDLSQGNTQILDQYTEDSLWRSTFAWHKDMIVRAYTNKIGTEGYNLTDCVATGIMVSQYYPLLAAVYNLWPTYLQTFLFLAFVTLLIWLSIRRHLEKSFKFILSFANKDYSPVFNPPLARWREVDNLLEFYTQAQSQIRQLRQDNQQLTTALDYAASAHAHRREMISHITGKWIAPLTVIQNHANDLRDESSVDHKEQHLTTILAQAQMMDAMVMEMLDLSRLEAGKVKLSADEVCLSDLTKQIFEKLSPASEEKELTVHMHTRSFKTVADEGRITQVITLLAAYAIQISPEGKNIHVSTCKVNQKSLFILDIPCAPLPQEVLRDIWNTYIPTDASDTSAQTGLGLAFVKAIIELHRGSCKISNTSTGIEIRFELP